jgi:hypothetical protein
MFAFQKLEGHMQFNLLQKAALERAEYGLLTGDGLQA